MRNVAIIPARSGSKGLKDKNIKILNGKPLIAYTIEAAKESGIFDEIMVSTDSKIYAEIAKQYGAAVPFMRSAELADDTTSSWDVVRNVLKNYTELGKEFDTVTLLQPTSPLRTAKDIINGHCILNKKNANSVIAVCEMDHSPLWSGTLPEDKSMVDFINPEILNKPRQSLTKYYRINGAVYIIKTKYFLETESIYAENSFALIMDKDKSIDIDNDIDFILAEVLLNKYVKKF
jgi:CMP-N,N'-diacetyllegionaminic acid synthase